MPDDTGTGTGTPPAPPATPPDGGTRTDTGSGGSDEPLRNYKEVVGLRQEIRGVERLLKEQLLPGLAALQAPNGAGNGKGGEPAKATAKPPEGDVAQVAGQLTALKRELALERSLREAGIADGKARALLERATRDAAPDEIPALIAEYVGVVKSATPATPATPPASAAPAAPAAPSEPPKIPPGTSNTGAPGSDSRSQLPSDILLIEGEAWRSLSDADRRKRWEQFKRERLGNENPFAARKTTK